MPDESWDKQEYYDYARSLFDPAGIPDKPELLSGVTVLEVAVYMNGPLVGTYLAELGAEVIKFELPPGARDGIPDGGDLLRYTGPTGPDTKDASLYFLQHNHNKRYVTLDLATPRGKKIFQRMATHADTDVLVENMRAGAMDKLGVGYRQLSAEHPGLIYLANNGPGQWGPLADMLTYDTSAQAMAGHIYQTGFPEDDPQYPGIPTRIGSGLGDYCGAMWGYSAILAALLYRKETGKGQFIECSQIEGMLRILEQGIELYSTRGEIRERAGNRDAKNASIPAYTAPCKDGYVYVAAPQRQLANLCAAMGRPELVDDPRFSSEELKVENQDALYAIIDAWLLGHTREELRRLADEHSFIMAPVLNSKDICELPHYRERGAIVEVDDPHYGKLKTAAMPTHFSETPARIKHTGKPVGADNAYVYEKFLGYGREELEQLRAEKVI